MSEENASNCLPTFNSYQKAHGLYDAASKLFGENKFEEAIKLYSQAIEVKPDFTSAYFNRALAYAILNKYDEATRDANKVISLEPNSCDAPYVMGIISEYKQDYAGAAQWYEKSLASNPNYEQARERLKHILERTGASKVSYSATEPLGQEVKYPTAAEAKGVVYSEGCTITKPKENFADVADMAVLKEELRRNLIYLMKNPELAREYGIKKASILLYGPPGTGKTFVTRAAAGEAQINIVEVKMSAILGTHVGETEKNIESVFATALMSVPCILFLDEIDGLALRREFAGNNISILGSQVNVLLKSIDQINESDKSVMLVAATNAPWLLDSAIKRPGRFDKMIYVPHPNDEARRELFSIFLSNKPVSEKIDIEELVRATDYYSSADLASICNEAAKAVWTEVIKTGVRRKIGMTDLLAAISATRRSIADWYDSVKFVLSSSFDTELYSALLADIKDYEKKLGPAGPTDYYN